MAGAGYKLFNTGDVLTAAQVNTYLMEQTVMVFANAAARTTALSGVVSEGMISYLKDTNAVEVYDGSNWVSSDDPNAIQNTIVDAKGDLIAASAADTPARLAVGNNGETLVADSSTSTGLRWQGNYAAGKNAVINGDFNIWQRGTSFSSVNNNYTADRWICSTNKTTTVSRQTFTAGTAPVAGYEGTFFYRIAQSAGGSFFAVQSRLEDVRLFAGQTVTLSFWAKADATVSNKAYIGQVFGSGGSANVDNYSSAFNITTSWARYSYTVTLASISGKTIGTNSYLNIQPILTENASAVTIDIWGVQVEAGNTATAFQTATGTLAGELCAAQRYYWRSTPNTNFGNYGLGIAGSSTNAYVSLKLPVTMRTIPTSIDVPSTITRLKLTNIAATNWTISSIAISDSTPDNLMLNVVSTGMTQNQGLVLGNNNDTAGFIGASAEL